MQLCTSITRAIITRVASRLLSEATCIIMDCPWERPAQHQFRPMDQTLQILCVWMNAAFGLDEMLQDAHFRHMDAVMEVLERNGDVPQAASSAIDSLSVFLSEMDQLEEQDGEVRADKPEKSDPVTGSKKKKLSSSKRSKRDKLVL